MIDLDNKILELFRYLISSGTKYLNKIDYVSKELLYKINDTDVSLRLSSTITYQEPNSYSTIDSFCTSIPTLYNYFSWEVVKPSECELSYIISIEGKTYIVPKLNRLEQAQTLNKIEHIIQEKESSILYSVRNTLAIDSSEEF